MDILEQRNHYFQSWMRQKGIQLWFIILLFFTWIIYSTFFLAEPPAWSRPTLKGGFGNLGSDILTVIGCFFDNIAYELGLYQFTSENLDRFGYVATFLVIFYRMSVLILLPINVYQFHNIILKSAPEPEREEEEEKWNENEGKSSDIGFLYGKSHTRPTHIHCMCIRLLTRGDPPAQPQARKAVTAAVKLFSRMCKYDHLKVHVVTQTKFLDRAFLENLRKLGATEAKEMYVPPDYATPKGTLFKARNICFWQDMGGVGKECDLSKSWILSLDEEAVISRALVSSFIWDVVNSPDEPRIGYALGPALMDVNEGSVSFMVKVMESQWIANHFTFIMRKADTVENTWCFHGGAYFARASCDRIVGNDWGPAASVSDDYTVGLAINDHQMGVKHLKGWFIEGTKVNLWGCIVHHARNVRGQIYATYNLPLSRGQLIAQTVRFAITVILPFYRTFYGLALLFTPYILLPGATQCTFIDMLVSFTLATQFSIFAFGANYLDLKLKETIGVMLLAIPMVLIFSGIIENVANITCIVFIVKDLMKGSFSYEMTEKPKADGEGHENRKKD